MRMIVTGSNGLIGSEVVVHFHNLGWKVHGIDNNMRSDFFGPQGDTRWNLKRLESTCKNFVHHEMDIRDRLNISALIKKVKPEALIHAAAQPSHDLAASRPFDDFDINAVGTLNLLEAIRLYSPDSPFVYLSTNKVYGDAPNELQLVELETRWDYADKSDYNGIGENLRIDQSKHSIFGASKLAADIMVQEYGQYFGLKTCCLRGGCLTGPNHSGVELHGFLNYLVKVNASGGIYNIFGYKGKQVRDNIHSFDVARFIEEFLVMPRCGEVYNIGGGRSNSCSILEAFRIAEGFSGIKMKYEYIDQNREGDHICYISNLEKAKAHYPGWSITISLEDIIGQMVDKFTCNDK